jgi:hypothetical protein
MPLKDSGEWKVQDRFGEGIGRMQLHFHLQTLHQEVYVRPGGDHWIPRVFPATESKGHYPQNERFRFEKRNRPDWEMLGTNVHLMYDDALTDRPLLRHHSRVRR